jgi:hypothetical protein
LTLGFFFLFLFLFFSLSLLFGCRLVWELIEAIVGGKGGLNGLGFCFDWGRSVLLLTVVVSDPQNDLYMDSLNY